MCSSGGGGGRATPLPLSAPLPPPLLPPLPPLPLPPALCLPVGAPPPPAPPAHLHLALPPSALAPDPSLVDAILAELKSQGVFDQFRKECIADVDTKPAYQNLRQRVEGSVSGFLSLQNWSPDLNKNQLREKLRKHILDSNFLDQGVERIVDQVVNPKISSVFVPQVEEIFYKYLGLEKPDRIQKSEWENKSLQLDTTSDNLLPNDLESVSPESVKSFENKPLDSTIESTDSPSNINTNQSIKNETEEKKFEEHSEDSINSNEEEFESPAFEPLEPAIKEEGCSKDSHLSGISDLTSHDSNNSSNANDVKHVADAIDKSDTQNNNSELSQVSSDSNLSDSNAKSPSISTPKCEINFQNTFSNIKKSDSSVGYDKDIEDIDVKSEKKKYKYDDDDNNSSDARQCFEEINEFQVSESKSRNTSQFGLKSVDADSENKDIVENFEMAKTANNIIEPQHHRDSIESKTSSESVKAIGSVEASIDSNESNSVFVHSVKTESGNEKESSSFENTINHPVSSGDNHNDSSNGSKNDSIKNFSNPDVAAIAEKSKEFDVKHKESDYKQNRDYKEKDRHVSSSSLKDKDRKDDSRHHSRSSHSRHSSGRRDSERRHSSSRDKKDYNSSKSSSRDKHGKSSSTSDSKSRHGSSSHKSSHRSSRHSDYKHSSSDKNSSHDHKYKNKDSTSKVDSKSEVNKDKTGSSDSNSHSRHGDKNSDQSGKYSHHSSQKERSNSRHSHSEKNTKTNGSNSSDDKKNDEKKNKKSKENCSSSNKHSRTRRSTDRDSNDGSGGSTKTSRNQKSSSSNNHSSTQKSKSSHSDNNSNSNYSGQSDTLKSDAVNITSGNYIKSEFNMFEFGSMSAIKRHNQNEKSAQAAKIQEAENVTKIVENSFIKSPDISISSPTQIDSHDKLISVKSPEIPNKKPVIRIDNQLKPEKPTESIFEQVVRCDVLKKPKCASNIYEAMKVMKIRKRMDKMEQKRKQEAIMLLEKQHNVPKNLSTVYSGISGPEVVLTCMKQDEIDSYSAKIKSPPQAIISEEEIKYFDNKYDRQLTLKLNQLKQYILKLEKECEDFDSANIHTKQKVNQTKPSKVITSDVEGKNGFIMKEFSINLKIKDASLSPSKADLNLEINKPDEVQDSFQSNNFNVDYTDHDSFVSNDTKDEEYYEKMELVLNNKSEKDIFEIILGSEASLDTTTVSYSGELLLNDANEIHKPNEPVVSPEEFGIKSNKVNRKRPSTSLYNDEKNFENDNKYNHNNNELLCDRKRKIAKKTPLVEKDLTKHNILNCHSSKIDCSKEFKNVKDLPLKLKIEIHKERDVKNNTSLGDDNLTKSSEVFQEK